MPSDNENRVLEENKVLMLGLSSIEEDFEEGAVRALDFLTERGSGFFAGNQVNEAKRTIAFISEIGKAAARQKMEMATVLALKALETFLDNSMGQQMEDTTVSILLSFGSIGKEAAEKKMEMASKIAASILGGIGNTAALRDLKRETIAVAIGLGEIGKSVAKVKVPTRDEDTATCISCLGENGVTAAKQDLEDAVIGAELMLEEIALEALEQNFENPAREISSSLEEIGKAAEEERMESAVLQAASALQTIMTEARGRYLNNASIAAKVALESFNEIDTINEEASIEKIKEIRETMKDLWMEKEGLNGKRKRKA